MWQRCFVAFLLVSLAAVPAVAQEPVPSYWGITWQTDFEAAYKKAKAENKPVMFGIMMDGERGCKVMLDTVYTDARIIAKSREFINLPCCRDNIAMKKFKVGDRVIESNPFFPGATTNQCLAVETKMRDKYQKSNTVVAPQHIFTGPDGKLLFKKEYWLTVEQMLALMDRALRMHRGIAEPEAKPAEGVKPGEPGAAPAEGAAPAVAPKGELGEAGKRLIRLIIAGPLEEKEEAARKLLTDESSVRATALVDLLLGKKVKSKKDRQAVIRAVNDKQYAAAGNEFTRLFGLKDALLRDSAIVTIEEMAAVDAVKPLLAHFKKEKDKENKCDVIRALGPCGAGNEEVVKFLTERLKGKNTNQRRAAAVAFGSHLPNQEVQETLKERYRKESSKGNVKLAILWAYMLTRDKELAPDVEFMVKKEKNGQMRTIGNGVIAVLEGRPPEAGGRGGRGGRGGGAMGGYFRLYRLFAPLFAKDRVERQFIKDIRERMPGRGRR